MGRASLAGGGNGMSTVSVIRHRRGMGRDGIGRMLKWMERDVGRDVGRDVIRQCLELGRWRRHRCEG